MTGGLVVALSGGVGGAKLALGLSRVLPAGDLLVVANTGDDFEHLGLSISPDIDTLTYVLAGLDNTEQGWGRRDETWSFMATIGTLGGADWFRSAIAILPCMSSARVDSRPARRCRRSRPTSAVAWGSRPACCR